MGDQPAAWCVGAQFAHHQCAPTVEEVREAFGVDAEMPVISMSEVTGVFGAQDCVVCGQLLSVPPANGQS